MEYCYQINYLISISAIKVDDSNTKIKKMSLPKSIIYTLIGIVMIVLGGESVVNNASDIAFNLGVSKRMISLTIIALGTSLPELVTSITATRKGECDLAIGNIVGSCIFNIGVVLAIPVAIFGGIDKINFSNLDIAVMILSVLFLFLFSANDRKITKKEGILFLLFFLIYYSYVIING